MPIAPPRASYIDPRNVVTEDAFRVAPELLGTPLARPWRRGAAMVVDGLLIALLSNASGVLFGLAAAGVLFRVSAGRAGQGYLRRSFRLMLRFGGAVVLFAVAVSLWDSASDRVERAFREKEAEEAPEARPAKEGRVEGLAGLRGAAEVLSFTQASDEAEARNRAHRAVNTLRSAGLEEGDIREMLQTLSTETRKPWLAVALDSALAGGNATAESAPASHGPDSLAAALVAASASGDTARATALRRELTLALAADTLTRLREELREARSRRREIARRLEAAEQKRPGVLATLGSLADDLGLGLGWAGLYFTAMLALWRGQTPGKRLMHVRVIRLDGKPIGWWASFERFGGYAAGFATGLLGFFQIYWDDNRQAVHDKISGTVVIRE